MSRLKEQYQNEIVDAMIKKFGYKNIMEVPKLDKVVINMGVGEAKENAKVLESAIAGSQVRKPLLQEQRTPWLTSKSERVCRSDVRLRLEARKCMSSLIV